MAFIEAIVDVCFEGEHSLSYIGAIRNVSVENMSNMQGAQGPFASQKQHVGDGNQAQSLGRQCSICERLSQEKDDTSQSL